MFEKEDVDLKVRKNNQVEKARDISPRNFVVNVISNATMLAVKLFFGLWFTRYLIQSLGVAIYGVITLSMVVTSYMKIVNSALNHSVGRYLTIEIRQKRSRFANQTFNTAFWSYLGISIILFPILIGFSLATPHVFDIPLGYERGTKYLFLGVTLAYLVSIVRSSFDVCMFASNRFDLQNAIFASDLISRMLLIFLLFQIINPAMEPVGFGILFGVIVSLVLAISIWRWVTPELFVNLKAFDRSRLNQLTGMSIWLIITQIGSLLIQDVGIIVVNVILGAEASGRYGSINQLSIMLRELARVIATTLPPVFLSLYATGQLDRMKKLVKKSVKLLGLVIALPIGLVVGLSVSILKIWLGPEFMDLNILLVILVSHLCINLSIYPLLSVQVAANKVKIPAMVTLILGLLNMILSVVWAKWGSNGFGIALAGALTLTVKNVFFIPIYVAYIQKAPWNTYLFDIIPGFLGFIGIGLISYFLNINFSIENWLDLVIVALVIAIFYMAFVYTFVLEENDRKLLDQIIHLKRNVI